MAVPRGHPKLGRGELTVVITKMPFSALSNREKESSWEGKLKKTTEQHDGCLPGGGFFLDEP